MNKLFLPSLLLIITSPLAECVYIVATQRQPSTNPDVQLAINPNSTFIFNTSYNIMADSHTAYDVQLHLTNTATFESSLTSTLTVTIDHNSALNTHRNNHSDTLLIVFSVADTQFISFSVHINHTNLTSKIYPQHIIGNKPSIISWILNQQTYDKRSDRISDGDQWHILSTNDISTAITTWPFTFELINNPIINQCKFSFYNTHKDIMSSHMFDNSFFANEDIMIYILSESSSTFNFQISNIEIQAINVQNESTNYQHIPTETGRDDINMNISIDELEPTQSPIFIYDVDVRPPNNDQGNKGNIETWFLVILMSSVVVFILARIIMKIPLSNCCKDIDEEMEEIDEEMDETDGNDTDIEHDSSLKRKSISKRAFINSTHASPQQLGIHPPPALIQLEDEESVRRRASSHRLLRRKSSNKEKQPNKQNKKKKDKDKNDKDKNGKYNNKKKNKSSDELAQEFQNQIKLQQELQRKAEQEKKVAAAQREAREMDKLAVTGWLDEDRLSMTSPSISGPLNNSSERGHYKHSSMETISEQHHVRKLSSVVNEVEHTRQLDIIQEDRFTVMNNSNNSNNNIFSNNNHRKDKSDNKRDHSQHLYTAYSDAEDDSLEDLDDFDDTLEDVTVDDDIDIDNDDAQSRNEGVESINRDEDASQQTEYIYLTM